MVFPESLKSMDSGSELGRDEGKPVGGEGPWGLPKLDQAPKRTARRFSARPRRCGGVDETGACHATNMEREEVDGLPWVPVFGSPAESDQLFSGLNTETTTKH